MNAKPYETPGFENSFDPDALALELLKQFDGMALSKIRHVLRRADFWLDATTRLEIGATEFRLATEALQAAAAQ